ncbi:glycosyltransferase family 4 protein [Kallotenue papyrolyticum]|uniref:glycosyltransferase family 4 protein n=1 Tax=Kallotenue papyrolyticum TaxID=1325125 RepID=UPI0004718E3F|nr:glycosyltransferase family 4 protein [Kallotenue papyrolyticum]
MRILYVASGITVPGAYGGSTHTYEVAHGLARRSHDVHVLAHHPRRRLATLARPERVALDAFTLHYLDLPKSLSLLGYGAVARLMRRLQPDVVMERYYNFAGAGVLAAARQGIPVLLEVNALIVDPPEVFKRRLDDRLGRPFQRWALAQCRMASRIVTPLQSTVPPEIARGKIVELPWGANVERFDPALRGHAEALRVELGIPPQRPIVVFLGSFRAWHGVQDLIVAGLRLLDAGEDLQLLLLGDGPERAAAERLAGRWHQHITFAGSVPHERVPHYLALAAVGVAPFNTARHPALRAAGFFWSPLKIYEYMAMALPVVTARIPPLNAIIREDQEGALFQEGDIDDLAAAIRRVLHHPERAALGQRARQRVVEHFSWQRHCADLEAILQRMIEERRG